MSGRSKNLRFSFQVVLPPFWKLIENLPRDLQKFCKIIVTQVSLSSQESKSVHNDSVREALLTDLQSGRVKGPEVFRRMHFKDSIKCNFLPCRWGRVACGVPEEQGRPPSGPRHNSLTGFRTTSIIICFLARTHRCGETPNN